MTLWARQSLFRELFDMNTWNLSVEETDDAVIFSLELVANKTFDLDSYEFTNMVDTITGVGQESANLIMQPDCVKFRIEVPAQAVPDDYMD